MAELDANIPGTNTGHGHVWARPDGVKARCGGPGFCRQCSFDAGRLHVAAGDPARETDEQARERLARRVGVLEERLRQSLAHIEDLCGADWSSGDNAESDAAQCFVRDTRGRFPSIRND